MSFFKLDDSQWFSAALTKHDTVASDSDNLPIILDPMAGDYYQFNIGDVQKAVGVDNFDLFRYETRWLMFVDVVGVVRSLQRRDKFYQIELDDGTGSISCTVWYRESTARNDRSLNDNSNDSDYVRLCDQLFTLTCGSQPNSQDGEEGPILQLGHAIHLRGRLKRFRGQLTVTSNFCRLISKHSELLSQVLHRRNLQQEIYSQAYDPKLIAEQVLQYRLTATTTSVVQDSMQILTEDGLNKFTKLDLYLNPRLTALLDFHSIPEAFDHSEAAFLIPETDFIEPSSKHVVRSVDGLISSLMRDGWIYPSHELIGGKQAYNVTLEDKEIQPVICVLISSFCQEKCSEQDGISFQSILSDIRRHSGQKWTKFNASSLSRILNNLEAESRIYQSGPNYYKIA